LVGVEDNPVPLIDTTMAHGEAAVETELTEETMLPAIAMCTTRKNGAAEHAHAVRPALLRSFRGRLMLAVRRDGGTLGMLDLHCHILPGVDDGAASIDESLAMALFYVQDGLTHAVATPHCHRHCRLLRADILPHVARLNADLAATGVPLAVLPGSEVQVTDTAAYRREFEAGLYCHLGEARRSPCWSSTGIPSSTRPPQRIWSDGSASGARPRLSPTPSGTSSSPPIPSDCGG